MDQHSSVQGVFPISSRFLLATEENFQRRTLKTTSSSSFKHDGASVTAVSSQRKLQESIKEESSPVTVVDKVLPPSRKIKTASVEQLKLLTLRKVVSEVLVINGS